MMINLGLQDVQETTLNLPVHTLAPLNSRLIEIPQQMAPVRHKVGDGLKLRPRCLSKRWQLPSVQSSKAQSLEIVDLERVKIQ